MCLWSMCPWTLCLDDLSLVFLSPGWYVPEWCVPTWGRRPGILYVVHLSSYRWVKLKFLQEAVVMLWLSPAELWSWVGAHRSGMICPRISRHRLQLLHATVWFNSKEIAILTKVQRLRRRLESTEKEPKNHFMTVCLYQVMKVGLGRESGVWVLLCMWSSSYSFVCVYATANHPQSTYPLKKKYTKTTCHLRLFDYLVWQWGFF